MNTGMWLGTDEPLEGHVPAEIPWDEDPEIVGLYEQYQRSGFSEWMARNIAVEAATTKRENARAERERRAEERLKAQEYAEAAFVGARSYVPPTGPGSDGWAAAVEAEADAKEAAHIANLKAVHGTLEDVAVAQAAQIAALQEGQVQDKRAEKRKLAALNLELKKAQLTADEKTLVAEIERKKAAKQADKFKQFAGKLLGRQ